MSETPRDVALRGLEEAVDGLREWGADGDYRSPSAFANAMNQLYTVENSFVLERGEAYFTTRKGNPLGRVVGGIVYARGLHSHARGLVDEIDGRRPFRVGRSAVRGGDALRGGGVTLRWSPFRALPPPHQTEKNGRDTFYENHVAGRDVLETFRDALQFFSTL